MSLIATRLQNWRVQNPALDKNMARPCEYGALDFFIEQTNAANSILSPELKDKAFASMGNTVQVPVINYDGDVTVSQVRSCVIGDDENVSALYTIEWATLSVGFTMVPTLYMNNEISYEHDFNRKMEKVCRALASALDVMAIAALESKKTQVFKDKLYYNVQSYSVQVPWIARENFMGSIDAMMRANCYPGMIHVIGGAGIADLIQKLAQKDIYNEVNKRNEYGNKVFHYTNNIVNEEGIFATAYFVEDGNVGVLTRVDRESLRNGRANGHEWGVVRLPYIDLPVGSHYYTSVGDNSQIAGDASEDMTCTVKEYFGFSLDVAFIVAYNNAPSTVANPIIKVEVAAPGTANPFATPVEVVNGETNPVNTKEVTASEE